MSVACSIDALPEDSIPDRIPPPIRIINGEEFAYLWDAPIVKGWHLGKHVNIYHCANTDTMAIFYEDGQPAIDIPSQRIDEFRDSLQDWIWEREEAMALAAKWEAEEWDFEHYRLGCL